MKSLVYRLVLVGNTFVTRGSIGHRMHHILTGYSRNNLYISADGEAPIWTAYDCNQPQYCLTNNYEPMWMTDVDYDGFDWGTNSNPFNYDSSSYSDLPSFVAASGQESHGIRIQWESCFEALDVPGAAPVTTVPPQWATLDAGCAAVDAGVVLASVNY